MYGLKSELAISSIEFHNVFSSLLKFLYGNKMIASIMKLTTWIKIILIFVKFFEKELIYRLKNRITTTKVIPSIIVIQATMSNQY